MGLSEWARELGIHKQTLSNRLAKGWPVELALSAPKGTYLSQIARRKRTGERFAEALLLERLGRAPATEPELAADLSWPEARVHELLARLRGQGFLRGLQPTRAGVDFVRGVVD